MDTFWKIVGIGLLGWVAWDLYYGYTFVHGIVYREEDPTLYWIAVSIWAALGVSCFFSWHGSEEK